MIATLKDRRMLALFALLIALLLIGQAPVHAYLDPGSGSMAFQAILGGIAAALAVGRLYWSRIRSFLSRKSSPPS
jgi:hypothetical protein